MLTPQALERTTDAYRKGYYAGFDGKPFAEVKTGIFTESDYTEGYRAGANDRKWDTYYSSKGRASVRPTFPPVTKT